MIIAGVNMEFDTRQFLYDFNVPTVEHSSTTTSRYIGLHTCFACGATAKGNKAYAGVGDGFSSHVCWVCHETSFYNFIQAVTGITDYAGIQAIYKKYGNSVNVQFDSGTKEQIQRPTKLTLPGRKEILPNVRQYLLERNFDPEYVWEKYKFRNTAMHSSMGYRIIIPYLYRNRAVSYTARDYTTLQDPKYKACKLDKEVVPRKEILYNIDNAKGKNVVVVEGELDAIRIGDGAVASSGTEIILPQLMLLASSFDNIFFLFDGGESEALKHAEEASAVISSVGKHVEVLEMSEGDPDEVFQDEKELIFLRKDLNL